MKQNLYAFLQTYVDLNLSFIFLQNLSLFKKNIYIYIYIFFGLLYPNFFFFGPKLDFILITFTLMLIHISYHWILYPHTKRTTINV